MTEEGTEQIETVSEATVNEKISEDAATSAAEGTN